MARRRYLSTAISTDKIVNRLATQYGDFAALFYTWLIPHATDDCALPGDPEELLMIVMPGRRDKSPEDVAAVIDAMLAEGLVLHDPDNPGGLMFPPESFYRHQAYIKEERRRKSPDSGTFQEVPGKTAESAKSLASFSVSSSVSSSPSVSDETDGNTPPPAREDAAQPIEPAPPAAEVEQTADIVVQAPWVGDDLPDVTKAVARAFTLVPEFNPRDGPLLAERYIGWRGYRKKPPEDWYRAWLNWLKKERDDGRSTTPTAQGPRGAATAARHGDQRPAAGTLTDDFDAAVRARAQTAANGDASHSGAHRGNSG